MAKIIGVNLAKPGDDRTVLFVNGRRGGKNAMVDRAINDALDAGHTVYDARTGDVRGADVAKDVAPKPPHRLEHRQQPSSKTGEVKDSDAAEA